MNNLTVSRIDRLMRLPVAHKTKEIDEYLDAKIGIMWATDEITKNSQYLKILHENLDELAEKTKEKRLRKIKKTEEELAASKERLETCTKTYKDVEETAKKQMLERAREIAVEAGGTQYLDFLMEYRNKKQQGTKLGMRYEDAYDVFKDLDSVLADKLRPAWNLILEIDDSPF